MSRKNKRNILVETLKQTVPLLFVGVFIVLVLLYLLVHFAPQAFQSVPIPLDTFMFPFVVTIIGFVFLGFIRRTIKIYGVKRKEIKRERKNNKYK